MRIRSPARVRSPERLASVLLLMVSLARAGAPPPAPPLEVVCAVGGRALLPCHWAAAEEEEEGVAHVEWRSRAPLRTVYERRGERTWASPGFQGRLAVGAAQLAAGDCSLELSDAQLMDGGEYDPYGLRGGGGGQPVRRTPLHSVRLRVHDHKLLRSLVVGDSLTLDLHTPHAQRVVFQERNGSSWAVLWQRGGGAPASPRLRRAGAREELVLSGSTLEDQGFYKVLDGHGLALSTLLLSVQESLPELQQDHKEHNSPVGSTAVGPCPPGLVPLSLLLWALAVLTDLGAL